MDGKAWMPVNNDGTRATSIGFGMLNGQKRCVGFAWESVRLSSGDGLNWDVSVDDDMASAFTSVAYGD